MTRPFVLLAALGVVTVALYAALSGVISVLLPQQIAAVDPEGKVASLALVSSLSFAATAIAQPLLGALSDRTRSRWGRRIPWMVGGALVGGAAVGLLGGAGSVALIAVLWVVGQFALNGTDIASTTYLVDGFPARRRGVVAGVLGMSAIVGGAAGAALAGMPGLAAGQTSWLLAGLVVLGVIVFVAIVREPDGRARPVLRFHLAEFVRGFFFDPRANPDFTRVFVWRLLFTIGTGSVHGYLLFIATDHVGLPESRATGVVVLATAVGAAGVVVAVVLGGWLSDRLGRRVPFLIAATALVAAVDLVPIFVPTAGGVLFLAAAIGIGLGIAISCGTALASLVLPGADENAGRGLGVFNVATNVAQAIAPILAGLVISVSGGYAALFALGAVLMVASLPVIAGVREKR